MVKCVERDNFGIEYAQQQYDNGIIMYYVNVVKTKLHG